MDLIVKKILELKPAPYNPRTISEQALNGLRASIDRWGLVEPIVWNKRTGHVVGGHQRLKVLEASGETETQVVVVDIDPSEEKALNVSLNNQLIAGDFTPDLDALLDEIKINLGDLPDLRLDELLTSCDFPEDEPDMTGLDDVPEPPDDPITQPGDLWLLGDHRVLCGDCTRAEDVERVMDGKLADMIFADPPYGVSYANKNKMLNAVSRGNSIQVPIEGDHKTPGEMSHFWRSAFTAVRSSMKPGAAYYVTGPQGGDLLLLLLALKDAGLLLKHMLIWAKNNHVLGRCDYHYKHEPIIYGWNEGSHKFYGNGSSVSLWEIDKPLKSDLHPTMKPVELVMKAIKNSSQPTEIVIDPFLGSGTTLIAAQQLNRKCYGLEIEPRYVDVTIKRWEDLTGEKARLDG